MSILVTGGAGYIGTHTLVRLIEEKNDLIVIDNLANSSKVAISRVKSLTGSDFPFYQIDVCDKVALEEIFKKHEISQVIHFAGYKAVGESVEKPLDYYDNNLISTIYLLELMDKYAVYHFVFSSSATVYGNPDYVPIKESDSLGPTNPYGRTKWMIEMILKDLCHSNKKWRIGILRYFNPVGAHSSGMLGEDPAGIPNNLLPFIAGVAAGKFEELKVFGNDYETPDGTGIRDYIHVDDLAMGHVQMLKKLEYAPGLSIYNLGRGRGYSVLEVVRTFEEVTGKKIPLDFTSRRSGDIGVCFAETELAEKELGFVAKKGLIEMMRDTWEWQQKNPNGYIEPTLVVMAAGMGSRYGGLKQMDPVGPSGEFILDYSIFDSMEAGFKKIVFIINESIKDDFMSIVGRQWEDRLSVDYVIQDVMELPDPTYVFSERKKPWGTGQAVLSCKNVVDGPFAVINADDFYGKETFRVLYDFLASKVQYPQGLKKVYDQTYPYTYGMVGFKLGQTVTSHGSVARGICTIKGKDILASIDECTNIQTKEEKIFYKDQDKKVELDRERIVSMNTWAFDPSIFKELENRFRLFLDQITDPISSEFFLPAVVDELIHEGKAQVKVMKTSDKWYGVTYREDKDQVVNNIKSMVEDGLYPMGIRSEGNE